MAGDSGKAKLFFENFWTLKFCKADRIYFCIRHFLCPKSDLFSNCSWLELSILFNNNKTGILNEWFYWRSFLLNLALFPCKSNVSIFKADFTKFIIDACISCWLNNSWYQTKSFENLPFTIPDSMTSRLCDVIIVFLPQRHSLMDFPTFGFPMIFTKPAVTFIYIIYFAKVVISTQ
jgi:hypothetical protein